jgi:hypothetical protein
MTFEGSIIGGIRDSTRIYRIFPRDRFLNLFKENQNALVRPTMWNDPFENVILKADVISVSGKKAPFDFHANVYGQCWTLEAASDAIWQIYSRCKDAVRVRTTVGKLIDSMRKSHGRLADSTCFIGSVSYLTEQKLKAFGQTVFRNGVEPKAIARSLLVKRKAYKHENEVRLIYIERSETRHPEGIYNYQFDPRIVIDQVMVDGRVEYKNFLPFKEEVLKLTGFSKKQVKRSLLYRKPEGFLVEIP